MTRDNRKRGVLYERICTQGISFLIVASIIYIFFFLLVLGSAFHAASSSSQGISSIVNPSIVDSGLGFTRRWIVNLFSGTLIIIVAVFLRKKRLLAAWISYFPAVLISMWPAYALYTDYSMPFSEIPPINYFPVLISIGLFVMVLVLLVVCTRRQANKGNRA